MLDISSTVSFESLENPKLISIPWVLFNFKIFMLHTKNKLEIVEKVWLYSNNKPWSLFLYSEQRDKDLELQAKSLKNSSVYYILLLMHRFQLSPSN